MALHLAPAPSSERSEQDAKRAAWACAADGMRAALQTPGLALDDRARLMGMMRTFNLLANRRPLYAVDLDGYESDDGSEGVRDGSP